MKLNKPNTGYPLTGAVLLACCAALPVRADYQSTVVGQGPTAYYRLSETVAPPSNAGSAANLGSIGTSANGLYRNYPTRGLTGPFSGSLAVSVNGVNQSVQAPYAAALNPGTFTIEAWVNPALAKPIGNLTCVLASMHSASPRAGWLIYQSGGTNDTPVPGYEMRIYNQNGTTIAGRLVVPSDNTPGTWHHLVYTYDGSTIRGYLDGAPTGQATGAFVPNPDAVFSVGVRSDNNFWWNGEVAEVAYYGTVLSDTQIAAHYSTATSNPSGYATAISGNSPLVYYRFREPADPVAANTGTLGTAGNALYIYNAMPGQAGPSSPTYAGFEAANKAVGFDGTGGSVLIPALNLNTNTATITAWIKPSGSQAAATGLIMSRAGTTTAGLTIDASFPGLGLGYNWNDDTAAYNWSPSADAGLPQMADGVWNFVALVVSPDKASVYIANSTDPTSFVGGTNPIAHANQAFSGNSVIGLDPGFTNRNFNGSIDEVTFFKRSLGAGELYTEFGAAVGNAAAKVFADPQAPANTLYSGDTLTLTVDAGGTPPLTYQWRKGGSNITGATDSTYTNPNLATTDSGNYDVVVTGSVGSPVTSAAAAIVVNPLTAPSISQNPVGRTLYAGGKLSLSVQASGGALSYYWQKDGAAVGTNGPVYAVASVAAGDAGNYTVIVSNRLSTATSSPAATVVVITPAAGSYEAAILADTPESWWRLNETSGTDMLDGLGRNDGYYTNSYTLNSPGVVAGNPGVADDGTPDFFGIVPFNADLASSDFTLECWAKVPDGANNYCPISFYESSKHGEFYYADSGAGAWRGAIGAGTDPYLFYFLGDTPGANIVPNKWMHLVITYGSTIGLRCYVNGQWSGSSYGNFPRNGSGPLKIGGVGPAINYKFNGTVDDVAFYKHSLTPAQAQAHYVAALFGTNTAPFFTINPASQSVTKGADVSFTGFADGSVPITYQWLKDGVTIAGQTTTILNLSSVDYSAIGAYALRAANPAGTNVSTAANLVIGPPPAFANVTNGLVLHLRFDGDYTDSSGRGNNATAQGTPSTVAGKIGSGAFHYSTDSTAGFYNYLSLGTPADLKFGASTDFSVAYWVRLPSGYALGDLPFLCSAVNSYGNQGFTFAPTYGPGGGTPGGWSWYLKDDASHGAGLYGPASTINDGQWHHLVHSFVRGGDGTTYLDGVLVDVTSIASIGNIDTTGPINIGQDPTGLYVETGSGDLDDMGIWRRALSQSEAAQIYGAGQNAGRSFDTYGPVTMTLGKVGSDYVIVWQAGTLLQSDSPTGPWTAVSGATAPNYRFTPATTGNKFYKVQL